MENILELQKRQTKKMVPLLAFWWIFTVLIVAVTVPIASEGGDDAVILILPVLMFLIGILLTAMSVVIPRKKLHPSVQKLSPEALRIADAECLSGTALGNGVITRSGYLFLVHGKAEVVEPEAIVWVYPSSMTYTVGLGLIPVVTTTSLTVIDRKNKTHVVGVKTQAFSRSNVVKKPNVQAFLEAFARAVPDAYYGNSPENQAIAANFEQMVKNVDAKRTMRLRQ